MVHSSRGSRRRDGGARDPQERISDRPEPHSPGRGGRHGAARGCRLRDRAGDRQSADGDRHGVRCEPDRDRLARRIAPAPAAPRGHRCGGAGTVGLRGIRDGALSMATCRAPGSVVLRNGNAGRLRPNPGNGRHAGDHRLPGHRAIPPGTGPVAPHRPAGDRRGTDRDCRAVGPASPAEPPFSAHPVGGRLRRPVGARPSRSVPADGGRRHDARGCGTRPLLAVTVRPNRCTRTPGRARSGAPHPA